MKGGLSHMGHPPFFLKRSINGKKGTFRIAFGKRGVKC